MAAKRSAQFEYPYPPQVVFNAVGNALQQTFHTAHQSGPTTFTANSSLTALSYGEDIEASVQPSPSGSTVSIASKAKFPLQFIDWGVHRKNIDKVKAAVDVALGQAPTQGH